MNPKALYIHIPFCDHICVYCDFYKMLAVEEEKEKYFYYLAEELKMKKDFLYALETIYMGGGTPSSINIDILDEFLDTLSKYVNLEFIKEFTFECNPRDVNQELIDLFIKYNINRISLGVQSLNNEKLKFLRRNHIEKHVIEAIKLLQANNINNISCDIIYGLSTDTIDLIAYDLEKLIELDVKHISCYTLIIEDKTILNHFIKTRGYKPLSDDDEAEINSFINCTMNDFGYIHYEVSNFCKEGYESIHNLTYWNLDEYMGLGANASYFINNTRYTNINNLSEYYSGITNGNLSYKEKINLSENDLAYEFLMLGLRKLSGIDVSEYKLRFNVDLLDNKYVKLYLKNHIMSINQVNFVDEISNKNITKNYLCINEEYIYVSNEIIINITGEIYA